MGTKYSKGQKVKMSLWSIFDVYIFSFISVRSFPAKKRTTHPCVTGVLLYCSLLIQIVITDDAGTTCSQSPGLQHPLQFISTIWHCRDTRLARLNFWLVWISNGTIWLVQKSYLMRLGHSYHWDNGSNEPDISYYHKPTNKKSFFIRFIWSNKLSTFLQFLQIILEINKTWN